MHAARAPASAAQPKSAAYRHHLTARDSPSPPTSRIIPAIAALLALIATNYAASLYVTR